MRKSSQETVHFHLTHRSQWSGIALITVLGKLVDIIPISNLFLDIPVFNISIRTLSSTWQATSRSFGKLDSHNALILGLVAFL